MTPIITSSFNKKARIPQQSVLREVGIRGQAQRKAIKEFVTAAKQSRHRL